MDKWLSQIEGMVSHATKDMSNEQLAWHVEGKWSSAQILDHLRKTYYGTSKGYEKALAVGKPLATRTTVGQQLAQFTVLNLGYFPSGRKSPKLVEPEPICNGVETLAAIRTELLRLTELQSKAEQMFGSVKVMDPPVLGPLTANQWPRFHYVHARHHMKQIAALRQQMATAQSARA